MSKLNQLGVLVLAGLVAVPASAGILYETATNGGLDPGAGLVVDQVQFLGSRFTLGFSSQVTGIIAEMEFVPPGVNSFFMTVLQLTGPGTLPNNLTGDPFGGTPQLYTTTFAAGPLFSAQDVFFPVSLSLAPGTYAVVLGSGLFGAPADLGYMPSGAMSGNIVQPGADLIIWYDDHGTSTFANATWHNGLNQGERFVIQGTTPEPSSIVLIALGMTAISVSGRRLLIKPHK
jgi:hypothetical protein